MQTITLISVYSVASLYFLWLLLVFIFSFKKGRVAADLDVSEMNRPLSLVVLVENPEDFLEANLRAILTQVNASPDNTEVIVIDKKNNSEFYKEIGYDFPDLKKLYFHTPQLNIDIIRDILEHKAAGEVFLLINARNQVKDGWFRIMKADAMKTETILAGTQLVRIDVNNPRYFRAIDQMFKTTVQRSFARYKFNAWLRFDNMLIPRAALLGGTDLRRARKKVLGDCRESATFEELGKKSAALLRYKIEENPWKIPVIDRSPVNLAFYVLGHLMNVIPILLFLLYLKGFLPILPLIILMFAKFIGEGLVISRGARIFSQQSLLNDFWSWFFLNPPLSLLGIVLSTFVPLRFFNPKKLS